MTMFSGNHFKKRLNGCRLIPAVVILFKQVTEIGIAQEELSAALFFIG
jgi:hypothetical protein